MYYFLVFISVCSPLTFAFWPYDNSLPQSVSEDVEMSCEEWLKHYNINDDTYKSMIGPVAFRRKYKTDLKAHWIAAGYMGRLTINEVTREDEIVSPSEFCRHMGDVKEKYTFVSLKGFMSKKCTAFIYIYGYSANDLEYNKKVANSFDKTYRYNEMSMWASSYTSYIKLINSPITPLEFCGKLKTGDEYNMKMMLIKDVPKECDETIKSLDFTDNAQFNYFKARTQPYSNDIINYVPYVVSKYIETLLIFIQSSAPSIGEFCYAMKVLNFTMNGVNIDDDNFNIEKLIQLIVLIRQQQL